MLGAGIVLLALGVLAHHALTDWARGRFREQLEAATAFLAPEIVAGVGLSKAVLEARRRYGHRAVATVLRRWRNDLERRAGADISRVLAEIGEIDRLSRAASSQRPDRRLDAVRALAECGGAAPAALLIRAAESDPVPEIRRAAREGLLLVGSGVAIEAAVRSYLRDARSGRAWRRSFVARMVERTPDRLLALIDSGRLSDPDERLGLEALGDTGYVPALPSARARLIDSDPELRAAAARTLGKLRDGKSAAALVELLGDPIWYVRAAAAGALGSLPEDARGSIELGRVLGDSTWWVRANAARSLSQQGGSGVHALIGAVGGEDRYARQIALSALAVLDLPAAARRELGRAGGASAPDGLPNGGR